MVTLAIILELERRNSKRRKSSLDSALSYILFSRNVLISLLCIVPGGAAARAPTDRAKRASSFIQLYQAAPHACDKAQRQRRDRTGTPWSRPWRRRNVKTTS